MDSSIVKAARHSAAAVHMPSVVRKALLVHGTGKFRLVSCTQVQADTLFKTVQNTTDVHNNTVNPPTAAATCTTDQLQRTRTVHASKQPALIANEAQQMKECNAWSRVK
jgi:hypothetical protein